MIVPHTPEISDLVLQFTKEHQGKTPTRMKAKLHELVDKLKSDPNYRTREKVQLFLDELLKQIENDT